MPRTITIDVKPDDRPYEGMARQNRALYDNALLLGREGGWLNRHVFEAQERTQRIIEQLGGLDGFKRIERAFEVLQSMEVADRAERQYRDFLKHHEVLWPGGFSDFIAIIGSDDLNDPETDRAIRRLARCFGLQLKNQWAKEELKAIARRERKDYANLLRHRYFPEAIRATIAQMGQAQRMRIEGNGEKYIKTRKGNVAKRRPYKLSWFYLVRWFRKQVYKNCCERLSPGNNALKKIISDSSKVEDLSSDVVIDGNTHRIGSRKVGTAYYQCGMDALTAAEGSKNNIRQLAQRVLDPSLAPKERELLELILDGYSRPKAAKKMHIKPSTARVLMFRIRKKTSAISSS